MTMNTDKQKEIRRTVTMLSLVAIAFYLGFILMGVLRA